MPHQILLCEDEPALAAGIQRQLEDAGHRVVHCREGVAALRLLSEQSFSLLVLDIMLPDMDGTDVCRRMRGDCHIPVIMISSHGSELDHIVALEVGADDYLARPFGGRELLARVQARLRRCGMYAHCRTLRPVVDLGPMQLDPTNHQLWRHGEPVHLTPKEYELLSVLAEHRGTVVRSAHLLMRVWGYDSGIRTRTLDVHIGRLRAKLEPDTRRPQYILTVPGVGYRLCVPEASEEAA